MKYKYIIFDFNGTIIDDVEICYNSLNMLLEYNGQKTVDLDRYKHVFTFPIIEYYKNAGLDFSKNSFQELANMFIEYYQPRSLDCKLYENTISTFQELINRGYKLVVLSASEINNLTEQLKHFKIYDYFYQILGTSDIYAHSKIEIGINFIKNNNINPKECLMIGDTLHDLEVANKMNIDCILTSSGHQAIDVLEKGNVPIIENISKLVNIL